MEVKRLKVQSSPALQRTPADGRLDISRFHTRLMDNSFSKSVKIVGKTDGVS